MPSYGTKAASSLYSLGFAKSDCIVTIADFDVKMKKYWKKLGLKNRLVIKKVSDYAKTDFADSEFTLS